MLITGWPKVLGDFVLRESPRRPGRTGGALFPEVTANGVESTVKLLCGSGKFIIWMVPIQFSRFYFVRSAASNFFCALVIFALPLDKHFMRSAGELGDSHVRLLRNCS
jgi:hypothetical protein